MAKFSHLHNHSTYSLLDGLSKIDEMVKMAKELNFDSLAITDHGNMFGVIEFYDEAKKHGLKPIVGCEMYVAPDSMEIKSINPNFPTSYHLILLAKNEIGYKNLMMLSSLSWQYGFYYKPRIDKEILGKYSEGLICLSACMKGEVGFSIINDNDDLLKKTISDYIGIFGNDFYLEIQNHGIEEEEKIREKIKKVYKKYNIGLVATNDIHYLHKYHAGAHDVLLCVQTKKNINDTNRMRYKTADLYMKSAEEMKDAFKEFPLECIENTLKIADQCNLNIELGQILLPNFPIPQGSKSQYAYLANKIKENIYKKFPHLDDNIKERVVYELGVIKKMNYESYFLIVEDFINYAKSNGIPVGPGRGSVAGSIVAYILGITEVNPIEYGLIFERFLNPDRVSMPDIDIDFSDVDRGKMIEYVINKYGNENVSQIATFNTMNAKSVIKDVGRAIGITYQQTDEISKKINPKLSLAEAIAQSNDLKSYGYKHGDLFSHSLVLEGSNKSASIHAAGVIISPKKITDYTPLFISNDVVGTQYDMYSIEKLGLLKIDFLGLRTLSVIKSTIEMIDEKIDISKIPFDNQEVYDLFCNGETVGIFQFESSGMRDYLKKLIPCCIEDLSAMNALYRPGPLYGGVIDSYIKRKHHKEKISYLHPILESILKPTYGIMVYQEQAIEIAHKMAGFTMARADTLRKAIGKKNVQLMQKQKEAFISGAIDNGVDKEIASSVFNLIDKFSGYSFNKCITGDTIVRRASRNKLEGCEISIKNIYDRFRAKSPVGKKYRSGKLKIMGYDGGKTKIVRVKNIFSNGIQKVWKLTTSRGYEIKCTKDHKLFINNEWIDLSHIKIGDKALVTDFTRKIVKHLYNISIGERDEHKSYHGKGFPNGSENPGYIDGAHVLFEKNKKIKIIIGKCEICNNQLVSGRREIHHVDFNRNNNNINNLQTLCVSCHKKCHYQNGRIKRLENGYNLYEDVIVDIKYMGEEETYDLEIDDDTHAFFANNILSHNSHSVSYSIIGYRTAYLKKYYPKEFMAASLNSELGDQERMAILLNECRRMGIEVTSPSINFSDGKFSVKNNKIIFGLAAIRNIGEDMINNIILNRPYRSFYEFVIRNNSSDYNVRKLQSMITAGAFDEFGKRKSLYEMCEYMSSIGRINSKTAKYKTVMDVDLLDKRGDEEWSERELLRREKESLGVYLTSHPLDEYTEALNTLSVVPSNNLSENIDSVITVAGMIVDIKKHIDKKGGEMAFLTIEDQYGEMDIVVFSKVYDITKAILNKDEAIFINGKCSGDKKIIAETISRAYIK